MEEENWETDGASCSLSNLTTLLQNSPARSPIPLGQPEPENDVEEILEMESNDVEEVVAMKEGQVEPQDEIESPTAETQ